MKRSIVTVLGLAVCGCATSNQPTAGRADANTVSDDLVSAVVVRRFEDQGENILCDQPAYLQCFGISNPECVSDQTTFKSRCIDYSTNKVGELQYERNGKEYARAFSACMAMHHLVLYKGDIRELGNCLKTAKYDKEIATNSLTR